MPDAKGPPPWESRPGSHLAPALCPFLGCKVRGFLVPPWEPLKAWVVILEELLCPEDKRGGPTQKGGILALWAPSVCQTLGLLSSQLPEAGTSSTLIA